MAITVVTPADLQTLAEGGKVEPFKAPTEEPAKGAVEGVEKPAQARGPDGKFTTVEDGGKNAPTDKSAKADKSEDDDEGGDDLPEKARKVIGKKHRAMKEAEEFGRREYSERRAAEERAAKLERELEEERAKSRPAPAKKEPPKPADFANAADYTEALVKFRLDEERAKDKAEAEAKRVAEETQARQKKFADRAKIVIEQHPDYEEVVDSIKGTDLEKVHVDVIEFIQESDLGPDLIYHLAKHPDELQRIRTLSPKRQLGELGKLEARLEKASEPTPKLTEVAEGADPNAKPAKVSKAPAPIAPLGTEGNLVVKKDPSQMNFAELRAHREQERRERASR